MKESYGSPSLRLTDIEECWRPLICDPSSLAGRNDLQSAVSRICSQVNCFAIFAHQASPNRRSMMRSQSSTRVYKSKLS